MAQLLGCIARKYTDANNVPLSGGKIFAFEAGTSTPLATYTDASGAVAASHPIIIDSEGRADLWLSGDSYKFVIKDSLDNVIETIDDVAILGAESVTTSILADGAVTTGKINSSAVTTTKIADNAVTPGKLSARNYGITDSSESFSDSSDTEVDVDNLTEIFTATGGRPVLLLLQSDGTNNSGLLGVSNTTAVSAASFVSFYRDSTRISRQSLALVCDLVGSDVLSAIAFSIPLSCVVYFDTPLEAGEYTYKAVVESAIGDVLVSNAKLVVVEL